MRRRNVLLLIVTGVLVFLVVSALLARALSVGGAEDSAITSMVRAQARGDVPALQSAITGCHANAACQERAVENATSLKRAGRVSIIQIQPSAGFSLSSTVGTARVVWLAGASLPIVQCVRVRHAGNVLEGFKIELLVISRRIKTDADCPSRF